MYFNCKGIAAGVYALLLLSMPSEAQPLSESSSLTSQPNKCVALTQGRQCFAKVVLKWQAKSEGDYCLAIEGATTNNPHLRCWSHVKSGELLYDMQANEDVTFVLLHKRDNKALSRSVVQVSWLYKSNSRKRRWRLF